MITANDVPLSPLSFLNRAADVFPAKRAVVGTPREWTYAQFREHACSLAAALTGEGIAAGDRVAILARNTPEMLLSHYGVPAAGAVLVPLNIRLAAAEYLYILQHSSAKLLLVDPALADRIEPILGDAKVRRIVMLPTLPGDPEATLSDAVPLAGLLDAAGFGESRLTLPRDEHQPIATNYTSGTTGQPKGAVYTHRGAYLNALGLAMQLELTTESVYLWTLPMFHCDGWCFTWAVTAPAAAHLCLPKFEAQAPWDALMKHEATHLCGAPVVLSDLARHSEGRSLSRRVRAATGGAPPAPSVIRAMKACGVEVIHLYGLTETYGPSLICEIQPEWRGEDDETYSRLLSRQGVRTINVDQTRVVDENLRDVAANGVELGELVIRSNTVMVAYHDDEEATNIALRDGWLHTGDLAVVHPDGYIELRDRSKDIIISGGENVSSIEVENVLLDHPAVLDVAVVAQTDDRWGEVPVAVVQLTEERAATEKELIAFVRKHLAGFKAPKQVLFRDLPKTSTGKTQKFELRRWVAEGVARDG